MLGRSERVLSLSNRKFACTRSLGNVVPNSFPKPTGPSIYLSKSNSPYFNIAFEDWLFRNTSPELSILLLYRNHPCVVIGRNQNPWKEINFPVARSFNIPFVRRRSGGGTVYHDLGNTNYSIFVPRNSFDRRTNAELVSRALQTLDIPAEVNDRNDITVNGFKICFLPHPPCSAYKIVNKRAYHHGTMLIDTRLDTLGDLLRNTKSNLHTKGVDSVRSAVRNLKNWNPEISHQKFVNVVAKEFQNSYGGTSEIVDIDENLIKTEADIGNSVDELQSWDWSHGQTPEFTHDLRQQFSWGIVDVHISSKKGLITSSVIRFTPSGDDEEYEVQLASVCHTLERELEGAKYGILDIPHSSTEDSSGEELAIRKDIIEWLKEDM